MRGWCLVCVGLVLRWGGLRVSGCLWLFVFRSWFVLSRWGCWDNYFLCGEFFGPGVYGV